MIKSRAVLLTAGVIAVVLAAPFALSDEAQAATRCAARMAGNGTGIGIAGQGAIMARANAQADWSRQVEGRIGKAYANVALARTTRFDCRQGVLETKCVFAAVPCAQIEGRRKRR